MVTLRSHTTRRSMSAVALALALVTGGCGGTSGNADDSDPKGSNAVAEDDDAAEEETEPEAEAPTSVKFGETYTYDDGLSVVIGEPKKYKLPAADAEFYTEEETGKNPHTFEVRIINKTKVAFDVDSMYLTAQSSNVEAEQLFLPNIDGISGTALLPGREGKYTVGFDVADLQDIVVEVSPDFGVEYQPFYVTS